MIVLPTFTLQVSRQKYVLLCEREKLKYTIIVL